MYNIWMYIHAPTLRVVCSVFLKRMRKKRPVLGGNLVVQCDRKQTEAVLK